MEKPIRVLCVFSSLDRGGAETMCMDLYRHIDRSRVQFDFVKHSNAVGAYEEEIHALGGRIFSAPRYSIINRPQYLRWWRTFLRAHPEYQIVHGHFFTISALYFREAKRQGRITVGHSHCTQETAGTSNPIKHLVKNHLISQVERYADHCFACSADAGKWVFPHRDVTVLKNAIQVESFRFDAATAQAVRKELGLGDALVVGSVGRIVPQKNPLAIIDIFSRVHAERPESKLLWVGDGPLREKASMKVKELKLDNSVLFLGVRNDVNRLMQAMDAFILPSLYEGLGIVLIEAQTAGVESFCSDVVPREAAVTPLLHMLPLDSFDAWSDAIARLSPNGPHGNTAEQIIDAGYDIHTTAAWLQAFYLRLAQEKTKGQNKL